MKVDKAVCTNETMEDLYRAIRYETVFTALVENKILAIKRECDERQRLKKTRAHFKLSGLLSSKKICCAKHDSLTNAELALHQPNSKTSNLAEPGGITPIPVRDVTVREERLLQPGNLSLNELFKATADDSNVQGNFVEDISHDDKIQCHESESISSDKSKKITFQSGLIDDKYKMNKNQSLRRKLSIESSFSHNSSSVIESYVSDDSHARKSRATDVQNKLNLHENTALLDHERHRLRILEARSISAQCSPVFPRPLFRNNHNIATQVPCISDDNQLVPSKLIRSQNDIDASSIDSVNVLALTSSNIDDNKDQFAMSFVSNCSSPNGNDNETMRLEKTKFEGQFDAKQGFIKSFNQLTSQNQNTLPVITTIKSKKDALQLHRLMNPSIDLMTESKSASKSRKKDGKFGKNTAKGKVNDTSAENVDRPKRKHKRGHKCSDPLLIYPSSNGFQHCILSMPPNQPLQLQYDENVVFDVSLQMDGSRNRDLEVIMPSHRKHKHRHHHHHRHHQHHKQHERNVGKRKILVHDLDARSVKVIDPDDLPQRARWTIIATACLLLIMCLLLVGVTLRMAPFIDDMVRQENERLMQESLNRAKFARNFTETAPLAASEEIP